MALVRTSGLLLSRGQQLTRRRNHPRCSCLALACSASVHSFAATDAEIDNLVYELYGITDEERKIIAAQK